MSTDRFLGDPVLDRMMKVVLALSQELYVLRDRMRTIERLLDEKKVITRSDIDDYMPDPQTQSQILGERDAYIERLFSPLSDTGDPERSVDD